MITSFNILGKPLVGLVFFAFLTGNPLWIGLTVVIYAVAYILYRMNDKKIEAHLENMAAKNAGAEA